MPVLGGTVTAVVPAPVGQLVAVDDTNVYYIPNSGILTRSAKAGGGTPSPVGDATSPTRAVTVLGATAYWVEEDGGPIGGTGTIWSAPLKSGAATVVATISFGEGPELLLAVTTSTVFVSDAPGNGLTSFPLGSKVPDGGAGAEVSGVSQGCEFVASDTNAIYCGSYESSLLAIASNGTPTTLGMVLGEGTTAGASGVAFDDTDVYWVDATTVGTIMKAPKAGGTATIVARDTSPVALAVDANAIYWSDVGGNIMRLPK